MTVVKKSKPDEKTHHTRFIEPEISHAPWVLRITEHKDKPVPVFVVKERIHPDQRTDTGNMVAPRSILREIGLIYGPQQQRVLPVIRTIIGRICNSQGIPLELGQYVNSQRITFRGNLPLDAEAGSKLALIFKLQERILELDRVELIARRVNRFTREEAGYWLSRITTYGDAANRWALAGMKVMLGGQPGDKAVGQMLEGLRG